MIFNFVSNEYLRGAFGWLSVSLASVTFCFQHFIISACLFGQTMKKRKIITGQNIQSHLQAFCRKVAVVIKIKA
jgi:hypothetical protein